MVDEQSSDSDFEGNNEVRPFKEYNSVNNDRNSITLIGIVVIPVIKLTLQVVLTLSVPGTETQITGI